MINSGTKDESDGVPQRIQRKRTKGWRMPEGAVYVGRPTKWGNPFISETKDERQTVVEMYEDWINSLIERGFFHNLDELRGKDLACWCAIGELCHADILLKKANEGVICENS